MIQKGYKRVTKTALSIILIFMMTFFASFVTHASQTEENIAIVNDEYISLESYVDLMESMAGDETCEQILQQIILEKTIYQEAEINGIVITDEEIMSTVEGLKEDYGESFNTMLAEYGATEEAFINSLKLELTLMGLCATDVDVSDQAIVEYFEENKEKFVVGDQLDISHIVLSSEEEANEVSKKIKSGVSFDELVESYIAKGDTMSGYLGRFVKGQLIETIDSVIFEMEKGQISDPVKTDLGYHILRVDEIIEAEEPSVDNYRDVIELILISNSSRNPQEVISELTKKAGVIVFDEKFSSLGDVDEKVSSDYIAIVNGEPIEKKLYVAQLESVCGADALNNLIIDMIIEQAVVKYEIDIDVLVEEEIAAAKEYYGGDYYFNYYFLQQYNMTEEQLREKLRRELIVQEVAINSVDVSEEEIVDYYNSNSYEFDIAESVRASHILVDTLDYALELKKQLDEGADFYKVAKGNSLDEVSAEVGGDLGYFVRGDMVQEFENVAFSLDIGEISDPVESQFGYHIILVTDRKDEQKSTLEGSWSLVERFVKMSKAKTYEEVMNELLKNAKIEVFDEKYQLFENSIPEV